ncbi:uncharacterized protein BXZ73DRAFT_45967 [Epithele typhae]|uniref:uncharacterized protein n=1 Tax=Epithele typhae TaxID=378194 RepID=UPI002008AB62|nr:uncharacterized protein BXZ73DRAFT_45967 [Epithele typhae]KAH9933951.1 hypothetical protein BXZ73DRAFT_45967 [Epithele typhae]
MSDRRRYDPRLGDEDVDGSNDSLSLRTPPLPRHLHVQLPDDPSHDADAPEKLPPRQETQPEKSPVPWTTLVLNSVTSSFAWVPASMTRSKMKPVVRCAVVCWVSALLMIIRQTREVMGSGSFLILVASFLDTPHDPFLAVLEREITLVLFASLAWAWSCLGIFLANLTRTNTDRNATLSAIQSAQYLEHVPTIILAVFMFLGSAFFLFLKAKLGPGPYLFATIFACVCIDISITTSALYPYPIYTVGRTIIVPLAFHAALCIFFSAVIFPSTITSQYARTVQGVLAPLNGFLAQHRAVLALDPGSEEFKTTVASIVGALGKSEGGLGAAGAAARLIGQDIVFSRFSPSSIARFQPQIRRLVTRANGLDIFFTLIDPTRERFPVTPGPSRPDTPRSSTPSASLPGTPPNGPSTPPGTMRAEDVDVFERRRRHLQMQAVTRTRSHRSLSRVLHHKLTRHKEADHDHHLHFSLLSLAQNLTPQRGSAFLTPTESAVGVFESQRYMALEATRLSDRNTTEYTTQFVALLGQSCDPLLANLQEVLKGVDEWFLTARRTSFLRARKVRQIRAERLAHLEHLSADAKEALRTFTHNERRLISIPYRLSVLDPYRSAFDPKHVRAGGNGQEPPPHRYLFHCYMYQYHLIRFSSILQEILNDIIRLEKSSQRSQMWWPSVPFKRFLRSAPWTEELERGDDEDPDVVQGIQSDWSEDLGLASKRDPDALPPQNAFQECMIKAYDVIHSVGRGNSLFALKAGVLTILLSIPTFLKSTAMFAESERFSWGIFMGQLTLARFRGDTTFGLVARILSTFIGGLVGTAMWYVSQGNPFGLAATIGVCAPFFFFWRLYWPVPPMTSIILFVTVGLVVGYSWQNEQPTSLAQPFRYTGVELAWRRFVLVTSGVTAAFLFSFLPPSTTLRKYQRNMMSTTVAEIGTVYCAVVSFANTRENQETTRQEIVQSLVAIRLKLKRSLVLRTNIVYEFSLRGRWPSQRYKKILDLQSEIAYLLSHLMSVIEHLHPAWSRAFLRRTRFTDADFQGDVLAVISMISTALRTGNPLPQITPCPLLDRYMLHAHGLNVIGHEADDDYGLPRTMTIETLENEQYLCFSVGATTAFGIVLRLDKLMVATKELVGEQYHIRGIGVPEPKIPTQSSVDRPGKDV